MFSILPRDLPNRPSKRPMQSVVPWEITSDDSRGSESELKIHRLPIEELVCLTIPRANALDIEQGKVAELRLELNSGGKKDKNHSAKKVALKKIVANMTMSNNDMVALFPDVVGCMQIPSLEIKKM